MMSIKLLAQRGFAVLVMLAGLAASIGGSVQAATIDLVDYCFNIDASLSCPTLGDPIPASVDQSGFDTITGLGAISVTIQGIGGHAFDFFIDLEIDQAINTFFNESGASNNVGLLQAGQSWEIDEPGFVFGDIFANLAASTLDGTNGVPAGLEEDVSMALGWDFALAAGETAIIDLIISDVMAPTGFFLSQFDPDSQATVYLSSTLRIRGGPVGVPEPGSLALFAVALAGLAAIGRRRCNGSARIS